MTDSPRPASADPLPPEQLADRLMEVFALVGPLYRRVQRKIEQDNAAQGVSAGVRAVLDLLHTHGDLTVPQMGRLQSISRQFVQRMTNEAAARDWVTTLPNPAHQRSPLVHLTGTGRAAIEAITHREKAMLAQIPGGITDAEVDACLRVLGRMVAGFAEVEQAGAGTTD
ncbi:MULTISPECIES: MarR family winged helix-turn-helix transcriptional regulator [Streptomyces]|uniref:MarR family transcriptional regulator n=4 Tax=Streptomyces TaxID=1883 RepID=A0A8H9HW20_9ACTN|nr:MULTISPECIES: MarR family transcriptional regulator [Streptomyces]NEC15834.1 MarR family transcriptional regulator [Streptomyces sp. SID8014]NEE31771.1 MarR family transcriptional regulator [Streptomyces sp. SID7982]NEE51337.1 MarR family transcriptional regulator [Streptomyces sp. SID8455]MBL3805447.1 MarR family transcriptional regulator [Streptomyces sp. BRB081]MDQ0294246.1 DNA-binding MarR family transcriptional regulator [Streptomyces sp. DSM 41037]